MNARESPIKWPTGADVAFTGRKHWQAKSWKWSYAAANDAWTNSLIGRRGETIMQMHLHVTDGEAVLVIVCRANRYKAALTPVQKHE